MDSQQVFKHRTFFAAKNSYSNQSIKKFKLRKTMKNLNICQTLDINKT